MRRLVAVCAVAVLACGPARALHLSEQGGVAYLSGSIEEGAADRMRDFLAQKRAQPIRILYLYSPGGMVSEAIAIGDMIRKAGLATAVDAGRAYCDSACTMVFAAGVRRHYVNADRMEEGLAGHFGLGFHLSRTKGDARTPAMKSEAGSDKMRAYYARMGVPRAIDLCQRAAINTLYRPGGRTALAMGIATSLAAP
ncbi:MAG: hypothetical protein JNK46_18245 [Methylobacteriaceae bacterium]|nr:hypothetical protein [Methylobacteriaceae bacterium]